MGRGSSSEVGPPFGPVDHVVGPVISMRWRWFANPGSGQPWSRLRSARPGPAARAGDRAGFLRPTDSGLPLMRSSTGRDDPRPSQHTRRAVSTAERGRRSVRARSRPPGPSANRRSSRRGRRTWKRSPPDAFRRPSGAPSRRQFRQCEPGGVGVCAFPRPSGAPPIGDFRGSNGARPPPAVPRDPRAYPGRAIGLEARLQKHPRPHSARQASPPHPRPDQDPSSSWQDAEEPGSSLLRARRRAARHAPGNRARCASSCGRVVMILAPSYQEAHPRGAECPPSASSARPGHPFEIAQLAPTETPWAGSNGSSCKPTRATRT